MKNKILLIEQYYVQQKKYNDEKINKIEKLNLQLKLTNEVLNDLRVYIRNNKFKDIDEEIDFFKRIKPNIYADFIFYNSLLKYHVNKPNTTNSILKNYFKNELKKLESKKRKNLKFYQYYKYKSTFLDPIYFLRENKQLDLFSIDISIYLDSEFYTSHDKLAAEVIAYEKINGSWVATNTNTLQSLLTGTSGYFNTSFVIGDFPDDPRLGAYRSTLRHHPRSQTAQSLARGPDAHWQSH